MQLGMTAGWAAELKRAQRGGVARNVAVQRAGETARSLLVAV